MASKKKVAGAPRILVLHGPNLNLLGTREPAIYGAETLEDINKSLKHTGAESGVAVETLQSNAEYVLVDRVQAARADGTRFIVINPAA
ncbi:MAG TPA: type II 3-dehydroquinate dehydratase, partial [Burkholderiales bacterium]|nr:type II 3-dehydroquinate dehydratase [Burkholderiales bacterium]